MALSRIQIEARDDFELIWRQYHSDRSPRIAASSEAKRLLRVVHSFGYGAALLNKAVPPQRAAHKRVFLREFASDAIHLLHVLLVGDVRAGHFYLRSGIENLWRHVYFKDHAVEYRWQEGNQDYFLTIGELRSYCSRTDDFHRRLRPSLERVESGYARLSRCVHSSTAGSLQLRRVLADIRTKTRELSATVKDLRSFGRDMILLLLVLHAADTNRLAPRERSFVRNLLDAPRKQLRLDVLAESGSR